MFNHLRLRVAGLLHAACQRVGACSAQYGGECVAHYLEDDSYCLVHKRSCFFVVILVDWGVGGFGRLGMLVV